MSIEVTDRNNEPDKYARHFNLGAIKAAFIISGLIKSGIVRDRPAPLADDQEFYRLASRYENVAYFLRRDGTRLLYGRTFVSAVDAAPDFLRRMLEIGRGRGRGEGRR